MLGIGELSMLSDGVKLMECRWLYKSGMTPDEVLLIKCFDSKLDGRARRVPHTAFEVPGTEDKEGRESIEIRALVFHENDSLE
jgi:hypothetical protein